MSNTPDRAGHAGAILQGVILGLMIVVAVVLAIVSASGDTVFRYQGF